jgi:hypothetical protein
MPASDSDKVFAGSIPKLYETHLVPLIFEPYAQDLARRLASKRVGRVLEIAAGTAVVTREMPSLLPAHVTIVATDLNQPMSIKRWRKAGAVDWRRADTIIRGSV